MEVKHMDVWCVGDEVVSAHILGIAKGVNASSSQNIFDITLASVFREALSRVVSKIFRQLNFRVA